MERQSPPPHLRGRVAGTEDENWFFESGQKSLAEWKDALAGVGVNYAQMKRVLDFGCGCGRVLSWMAQDEAAAGQQLLGCDVDPEALAWLSPRLPDVRVFQIPPMPPMALPDDDIDLVVSHSVFTHLPEDVQFAWLDELHRVTRKGGTILTSIHGLHVAGLYRDAVIKANDKAAADSFMKELETRGIVYDVRHRRPVEDVLPEYYGGAFHSISYIERAWLPGRFLLKAYYPAKALAYQDIVVLENL